MAEEKKEEPKPESTYSQTQVITYSGLAALVGGLIGYFIGEKRGEKKSNEKFEKAINKLLKAKRQKKSKSVDEGDDDQTFYL